MMTRKNHYGMFDDRAMLKWMRRSIGCLIFFLVSFWELLTSAPNSVNVSINTAVWIVMCRQPAIRAPLNGFDWPNFLRHAIKPGISFSAKMISLRPHSANEISATGKRDKFD